MPKIKTNREQPSGLGDRNGQAAQMSAFRSHILTKKTTKRKRQLRKSGLVHENDHQLVKKLIPYK